MKLKWLVINTKIDMKKVVTKTYITEGSMDGTSLTFIDRVISLAMLRKVIKRVRTGKGGKVKITIKFLKNDNTRRN